MNLARAVRRWRTTNENASSFASKVPTITKPSNDGVLDLGNTGATKGIAKYLKLWPILLGSDNDVTSMRLFGWHKVMLEGSVDLWFPSIILEVSCIACAAVGVAGAAVLNTERFCDKMNAVAGLMEDYVISANTVINSDVALLGPNNDTPAHIILPIRGFELYELVSDQTTGTATFNCLYALLDE